ncbi:hypothetical protein [Azospirillum canadense]|uniref:hypothetical protein n=1 Tax=Azospirillum canadense TaxID=403962 RepID=UPI0022264199|nr:hypothetical protein [Azospirillum canadense]MCW2240748.1 hypothetical protein [Azospirillum canadense]
MTSTSSQRRHRQLDETFLTNADAFARARHLAKHGRDDRVVYRDRTGLWHVSIPTAATLKAALLAIGTAGHFSVIDRKSISHRYNWSMALRWFRNARAGYA